MIRIDENHTIERDTHCWILTETVPVDQKRKNSKNETRERQTYHANIVQCCQYMLDKKIGSAKTLRDVIDATKEFEANVIAAVKSCQIV